MLLPRCKFVSAGLVSNNFFFDMISANMTIINKIKQDPTVIPIIVRLESIMKILMTILR